MVVVEVTNFAKAHLAVDLRLGKPNKLDRPKI